MSAGQLNVPGRFTIGKRFSFEAAHHIAGLKPGHKCSRPHGHSYEVEVILTAEDLTGPGFVSDFADLTLFGGYLADVLDHRDLNDVLPFEPTSELLACHLAAWFIEHVEPVIPCHLVGMRVSETASSWAQFTVKTQ